MEIASNNNAGINNNKVEFNYSNQRSTVWDCCINFTNKMFEYRQWKFSIENRDNVIEPLYHLVRKHALTIQPKTKDFIDNIFKLYEKSDHKISMATLRVIEYMDDALLEAIETLGSFISHNGRFILAYSGDDEKQMFEYHNIYINVLTSHGLCHNGSGFGHYYVVLESVVVVYKLTC